MAHGSPLVLPYPSLAAWLAGQDAARPEGTPPLDTGAREAHTTEGFATVGRGA